MTTHGQKEDSPLESKMKLEVGSKAKFVHQMQPVSLNSSSGELAPTEHLNQVAEERETAEKITTPISSTMKFRPHEDKTQGPKDTNRALGTDAKPQSAFSQLNDSKASETAPFMKNKSEQLPEEAIENQTDTIIEQCRANQPISNYLKGLNKDTE